MIELLNFENKTLNVNTLIDLKKKNNALNFEHEISQLKL